MKKFVIENGIYFGWFINNAIVFKKTMTMPEFEIYDDGAFTVFNTRWGTYAAKTPDGKGTVFLVMIKMA